MFTDTEFNKIMKCDNAEERIRQAEKLDRDNLMSGVKYSHCGLDPMTDTELCLVSQIVNRAEKMGILRMNRATIRILIEDHFSQEKFSLSSLLFAKDFIFADAIDMYHYAGNF